MDLERTRYAARKKKKVNRVLNISILIVGLLIAFFVYQIFFNTSEQAAVENEDNQEDVKEREEELDEEKTSDPLDLTPIETDKEKDVEKEREKDLEKEKDTEKEREQSRNERDRDIDIEDDEEQSPTNVSNSDSEGKWKPIGTVQQEPFVAVYEKDHVNWQEMTRALQVATGLGDDMIIWRIENGGNHQSAVGYVSTYENQQTPYQVRLEWVTNKGWKPVSVTQLTENRFLQKNAEE